MPTCHTFPKRTTCFFPKDLLTSDSMTENGKRKDKKGRKRVGKKGQKETEGDPTKGKIK